MKSFYEVRDEQNRRAQILKAIEDGDKAQYVLEFAERFMYACEEELLLDIRAWNEDDQKLAYYRMVCEFTDMVRSIVSSGERSKKRLEEE